MEMFVCIDILNKGVTTDFSRFILVQIYSEGKFIFKFEFIYHNKWKFKSY